MSGDKPPLAPLVIQPAEHWLDRPVPGIAVRENPEARVALQTEPVIECPECHAVTTRTAMAFNLYVCPHCDEHLKMRARDRLHSFFDQIEQEIGREDAHAAAIRQDTELRARERLALGPR